MMESQELKNEIDKGNKRLALICSVWCALTSIPLLFLTNSTFWMYYVIAWMILLNVGVLLSPKICKIIWKN